MSGAATTFRKRFGMAGLGALTLAFGVFITLFFYLGIWDDLTREHGRTFKAQFASAPQLRVGDPVKLNGQNAGRVDSIEPMEGHRGATVTMDIYDRAGPIYQDARASLRYRILLGGSFYVQIERGTSTTPKLPENGTIALRNTDEQVELDDLSQAFKGGSRQGLRTMPGELAKGLQDTAAPGRALDATAKGAPTLREGLKALRGTQPDRDLRRLIEGTARTVRVLDQPNDDLRTLISGVSQTVSVTAARNSELRQTIDTGPLTMTRLHRTLARLQPTLLNADDLVRRLDPSAASVAPTLRRLRPTLVNTDALLSTARPLVRALRPAVRGLAGAAVDGVPVLNGIRPSLTRLNSTIISYFAEKDPETGKSTTVMIGGTAAGFGGSAARQDANGHYIRFPASGGSNNAYLPCKTGFIDGSPEALKCNDLQGIIQNYQQYVPGTPRGPGSP